MGSFTQSPPNYTEAFPDLMAVNENQLDFTPEARIVDNGKSCIYLYKDRYVASIRINAFKEIETMRSLPEISIPVLGYILASDGWDIGYIMPLATAVPSDGSLLQKRQYMAQIISLVEGIHRTGLLHGDVKLANFLLYNQRIWLCDFEEAQPIDEAGKPSNGTMMYRPPWRVRQNMCGDVEPPLSIDDDLYGLGLSIWELFTGHRVYEDLDGVEAEENYIVEGYIVNVDEAVDPEAIATIWRYLQKGSRGLMGPGSKVYKVTGPPHESLTVSQYFHGLETRIAERKVKQEPSVVPWKNA